MLRCAWLLALMVPVGVLADQHPAPPVATGHVLYRLSLAAFRAYVGAIRDGQDAPSNGAGMQSFKCSIAA